MASSKKENRYASLVGYIFEHGFKEGQAEFTFTRDQFVAAAEKLNITLPKNIGDVLYSLVQERLFIDSNSSKRAAFFPLRT